ncbi:hypothetical protein HZ326_28588 [Fusarium oxysporum f. sp. albedinis]|nr:hypothetical protein HZ326_28588 [Fusarium oxysporum f. sp. albedinis]
MAVCAPMHIHLPCSSWNPITASALTISKSCGRFSNTDSRKNNSTHHNITTSSPVYSCGSLKPSGLCLIPIAAQTAAAG